MHGVNMRGTIVTFQNILEINHILEDKGLEYKLHLHDACGSQNVTVEPLGNSVSDDHYADMKDVVMNYFKEKDVVIQFLENGHE